MDLLIGTNTSSPHSLDPDQLKEICLSDLAAGYCAWLPSCGASGAVLSECHLTNHTIAQCAIKPTNIQQSIPQCPIPAFAPLARSKVGLIHHPQLILRRQELGFNLPQHNNTTLLDERPTNECLLLDLKASYNAVVFRLGFTE